MTGDGRFVANKDVIDCDIGGDRALMHLETNQYFTMNGTASEIWLSLSQPRTLDDLVGVVTDRFDVSEQQCRPDVEKLVKQMFEAGIIDVVSVETAQ